jgi:hypothetical protein
VRAGVPKHSNRPRSQIIQWKLILGEPTAVCCVQPSAICDGGDEHKFSNRVCNAFPTPLYPKCNLW